MTWPEFEESVGDEFEEIMTEQKIPIVPPGQAGYTIRIIEPLDLVSSIETRMYISLEETTIPVNQLVEKLYYNSVPEYTIHIINQSTGVVERTLQRRLSNTPPTFVDWVETTEQE